MKIRSTFLNLNHFSRLFLPFSIALLFFLLICKTTYSQITFSQFNNLTHYTADDGLASTDVSEMVEDKLSFIWIGTANGVSRFDGSRFTNFLKYYKHGNELNIRATESLAIDTKGERIWLGTDNGILTTLTDEIKFVHLEELMPSSNYPMGRIEDHLLDDNQILWTASFSKGLYSVDLSGNKIDNFQFKYNNQKDHSRLNSLRSLAKDPINNHLLWIGTLGGLIQFNCLTYEYQVFVFDNNPALSQNNIQGIYAYKNNVFLGTNDKGLILFNTSIKQFKEISKEPSSKNYINILDFYVDKKEYLWITTDNVLIQYDIAANAIIKEVKHSVKEGIIRGISFIDSRGVIWFGYKLGLFKYDPLQSQNTFLQLAQKSKLEKPMIVREIIFLDGYFYVLGRRSAGLYKVNPIDKTVEVIEIINKKIGFNLKDMVAMEDGKMLILSLEDILIYDPKTKKTVFSSLQINHSNPGGLQTVIKDHDGNFWIGTNLAGLFCLNYKTNTIVNYKEEFDTFHDNNHKWIQHLYLDSKDKLWIGKGSNTVRDLKDSSIICLNPEDTTIKKYKVVVGFQEDSKERIWMAGYSDGLGFMSFENFHQGISHQIDGHFLGVYPYTDSLLFTVGKKGLGLLNTNTIAHRFINLGEQHHHNVFRGPVVSNGKDTYLLGGDNGVLLFDPSKEVINSEIPTPYIIKITGNGNTLYEGENLTNKSLSFESGTNHLILHISAIGFHSPDQITYKYQFQEDWINLEKSREINFTNLTPGSYSFKIIACNLEESCSEKAEKYTFTILPPWYKTWWAYLLMSILLLGFIISLYRFQLSRKLVEQEANRLLELDTFKTKFYANITHEFRTPLTVIQGMADELDNHPDEEPKIKINLIKKNSQNLLALVNQMLDLSKIRAGKTTVQYQQDDIIPFLSYQVEAHQSFANHKKVGLQFYSEVENLLMDFDAKKIERVLINLISNAIKFTPEYGKVLVIAKKIYKNQNAFLQIQVKDNGIGISKDQLPFIFDRFHQANPLHGAQGTGIGLALVKEFTTLMSGDIKVESQRDKGTTFFVYLPITNNAPLIISEPLANKNLYQSDGTVIPKFPSTNEDESDLPLLLIIEDNRDVTYYLTTSLQHQYKIITSPNGKEGIATAFEKLPDIIISDVMMPEMDGFEVCKILKEDDRTNHIPIILLTAKATTEDKLEGLTHGADAYLIKPFEKSELIVRLNKLLEIRKTLQQKYSSGLLSSQPSVNTLNNVDSFIHKVEKIVLEHFEDEHFSITELSEKVFLSRSQVHRKIKALTGMSTAIYIRHIRLQKAKELLTSTNLSISEIAYQVGFKTPVYFSQIFKETFGESPSSLRN